GRAGYACTNPQSFMFTPSSVPQRAYFFTATIASGIVLLSAASLLLAQRPAPDGRPGIRSNRPGGDPNAKRENSVSITTAGDFRIIKSNGWPDHAPGEFPRRGNPNTASPQDYTFCVPLKPVAAAQPQRRGGWFFAVGVNGVPFEAGTAETW